MQFLGSVVVPMGPKLFVLLVSMWEEVKANLQPLDLDYS